MNFASKLSYHCNPFQPPFRIPKTASSKISTLKRAPPRGSTFRTLVQITSVGVTFPNQPPTYLASKTPSSELIYSWFVETWYQSWWKSKWPSAEQSQTHTMKPLRAKSHDATSAFLIPKASVKKSADWHSPTRVCNPSSKPTITYQHGKYQKSPTVLTVLTLCFFLSLRRTAREHVP